MVREPPTLLNLAILILLPCLAFIAKLAAGEHGELFIVIFWPMGTIAAEVPGLPT